MKLLFNYDTNQGNLELKELIGHIDKDIRFDKVKSDIITATKDLIKLVGSPVYDDAIAKYEAASDVEADLDLIYHLRYPIALDAIRNHIKASDVQHSNNGRTIRTDDNTKVPFEWMIQRDDEIFERKYYKAVDNCLDYLDTNSAVWKASNAYKESQKYYVRLTSDFEDYFPIDSRLLLLKLQPGFRQCERKHIVPALGKTFNTALKDKLKNNTALTDYETELLPLIKEACVFHALAWGMKVLRVTLFPEGVLQHYSSDRQTLRASKVPEKMEAELVAQEFAKSAEYVLGEIQKLVTEAAISEPDAETVKAITTPNFNFDDDDSFVSS